MTTPGLRTWVISEVGDYIWRRVQLPVTVVHARIDHSLLVVMHEKGLRALSALVWEGERENRH